MTPKQILLKKVSRDRYTLYWDKAMEFFETMVDASQKRNWNATGLAGVHCCISATDALLVKHAGVRSSSTSHQDVVGLLMGQETRNKPTDYWKNHEITKEEEYAILTNIIHQEWSDITVKEHKNIKGLKTQNLRDHMSEAELIFTALAELSTRQIAETISANGMTENASAGKKGGGIAKKARLDLEEKTGKKVVTGDNYLPPKSNNRIQNK